ncbi:MAG: nitroreductase family protein [Tetrasphaera sp.]
MSYADLVRSRRMTRRFADSPQVPKPLVSELVDLASRAPSAGNTQGGDYLVLQTEAERAAFWRAASPVGAESAWLSGVSAAPTLIVCLSNEDAYRRRYAEPDKAARGRGEPAEQDWPIPYWHTDVAMGAMTILLGAVDAGLGALFFGVPGPGHARVRAAFGIPADRGIVGVIALGHEQRRVPSPSLARPRRRGPDVLHWGAFGVSAGEDAVARETMPSETMPVPAEGG